ncbi:mediator of RNA polymerase-like protein II transcription subunit 6 [Bisporella sp. PMI_857]|nr:mediator of RNA polymerase-like protein II transcription subunit 6 [Bisporella sp. PMI_857]
MSQNDLPKREPPLDEVQWRDSGIVNHVQGLHANTILFYFSYSPFFDQTSNNHIVFVQNWQNPAVVGTRKLFESRLMKMSGLEFMVVQEPAETGIGAGTGVWVIRKQTRRKVPGKEDEITPHALYYVVGENIYMAPTVASILKNRMTSIISSVTKVMSLAQSLPNFSPAIGHTYMPLPTASQKSLESQQGRSSRENTAVPDSLSNSQKTTSNSTSNYADTKALEDSIMRSLQFDAEYMDDWPITGEPGNFHKGRPEKEKPIPQIPVIKGPVSVPAKVSPTAMPLLKTDISPVRKDSKSAKTPKTPLTAGGAPKPKKRKSKAPGTGGISPT